MVGEQNLLARIRTISWQEIASSVKELLKNWEEPDAIIGVSRGGVPISISLSYGAPSIPIGFVYRVAARGDRKAFYIFSDDRAERQARNERELKLSEIPGELRKILVVDDVATHGGTLSVARQLISKAYPEADLRFYCFAIDPVRLRATSPSIADRASSHLEIDNHEVWLRFPWQID